MGGRSAESRATTGGTSRPGFTVAGSAVAGAGNSLDVDSDDESDDDSSPRRISTAVMQVPSVARSTIASSFHIPDPSDILVPFPGALSTAPL